MLEKLPFLALFWVFFVAFEVATKNDDTTAGAGGILRVAAFRSLLVFLLIWPASGCADTPDRWELSFSNPTVSGAGCGAGGPLTVTVDDPYGSPRLDSPGWTCATVDGDEVRCVRPIGVDLGTIVLTVSQTGATIDYDGRCLFVYGPPT